jgi:hypothetical protein
LAEGRQQHSGHTRVYQSRISPADIYELLAPPIQLREGLGCEGKDSGESAGHRLSPLGSQDLYHTDQLAGGSRASRQPCVRRPNQSTLSKGSISAVPFGRLVKASLGALDGRVFKSIL